jgi:hypothetical protein
MKILCALLLITSSSAFASSVIDLGATSLVAYPNQTELKIEGAAAQKIYDTLTVAERPSYDNAFAADKSAAGIYCYNEVTGTRYTECEISIEPATGVKAAVAKPASDHTVVLSVNGESAEGLYHFFTKEAVSQDAEGYTYGKNLDGVALQEHRLTKSFDAVIYLEPSVGILR